MEKNHNGYEKSRVFEYMSDNDLRWDKRWIKRKLKALIDDGSLPQKLLYNNEPIDSGDSTLFSLMLRCGKLSDRSP